MEKGKYYAIGSEVKEWTHFSGHSLRNCALVCSTVSQRPKVVHAYYMSGRQVQASMSVVRVKDDCVSITALGTLSEDPIMT